MTIARPKTAGVMTLSMIGCLFMAHAQDVGVLGRNAEEFARVIEEAGIRATVVEFDTDFAESKVLLITPNAVRDNDAPFLRNGERFKQYVKDGGFLLVLHQNDSGWHDKWLPYSCSMTDKAHGLETIEQKKHPIFAGLTEQDFGAARGGVGVFDSFTDPAPDWKVLSVNHPGDVSQKLISALECEYGTGRVLLSGYDPFVYLSNVQPKDLKKVRLLLNELKYALACRGLKVAPELEPFERRAAAAATPIPGIVLASRRFFKGGKTPDIPGVQVEPTGRIESTRYQGKIWQRTKDDTHKYRRQRAQLMKDGFVIHWRAKGGKRVAGIHADGERVYVNIEIPASLIDEHTAYTSLITPEGDMRIETVVAVLPDGKFIIREIQVTNTGKRPMAKVEFHEFMNMPFMIGVPGYKGPVTYVKDRDILLATSKPDNEELDILEETCLLAGTRKSVSHSIERGGAWGQSELLYKRTAKKVYDRLQGRLITGESNNIDTNNNPACIFVWPLGDLEPGASESAAAIFAVGDDAVDLAAELAAAKAFYTKNKPLTSKADRKELTQRYAKLNWQEVTHTEYGEFINRIDPDMDGWLTAREKAAGTDPTNADTDGDGLRDYEDPDPLTPEPLIAQVTREEIKNDRIIGLSKRKIIRGIRGQDCWTKARDPKELSNHLAILRNLRINCVAIRVSGFHINNHGLLYGDGVTFGYKDENYRDRDILAEYIAACHRYDIDVRLEGLGGHFVASKWDQLEWLDKPGGKTIHLPALTCCNSWVKGVIAAGIFDVAHYPVEFMSLNEERFNISYHGERFLTGVCMCPLCTHRFKHEMGYEMPGLRQWTKNDNKAHRQWRGRKAFELHRWRQKCATEAWRYWNHVAQTINPEIKFMQQSSNEAGPYYRGGVGSDFIGGGLSAVDIGYNAGMGYGGDHQYYPYRYQKDLKDYFNHFVYPGAMKAAMASVPSRRGWIEWGGNFRTFWEPITCFGQLISPIAHGGKGVDYFALEVFAQTMGEPKHARILSNADAVDYLKMAYVTLDKINDWVFAASPPKQIAYLWDAASDEVYSVLEEARKFALSDVGAAQSTCMTYLFRTGYPFDMFYLHYADYAALKDYPVLVLPAALCVAKDRIPMLERLVREGASLVILGEYGQLDCDGRPHEKPVLLDLAGIEKISSAADLATGPLTTHGFLQDVALGKQTFKVRRNVVARAGTQVLAKMGDKDTGITLRKLGKGQVIFMPGNFVANALYPHRIEKPFRNPRLWDITRPGTKLMNAIFDHGLAGKEVITRYERIAPDAHADIEIALLEKSAKDKTLFVMNWEMTKPSVINLGLKMPAGKYRITEWSVKPSDKEHIDKMKVKRFKVGRKKVFTEKDLGNLKIELEPQQIRILHIE